MGGAASPLVSSNSLDAFGTRCQGLVLVPARKCLITAPGSFKAFFDGGVWGCEIVEDSRCLGPVVFCSIDRGCRGTVCKFLL